MSVKSYSGWIAFFALTIAVVISFVTGVVQYHPLESLFGGRTPQGEQPADFDQCLEVKDHNCAEPKYLEGSGWFDIVWSATVHNKCQRVLRVMVRCKVYDQNGFELGGIGAEYVTLQSGGNEGVLGRFVVMDENETPPRLFDHYRIFAHVTEVGD